MKVKIQDSINLLKIEEKFKVSKTKKKTLMDKTCYLLSLLTVDNNNYREFEDNEGYVNLCSTLVREIIRPTYYKQILDALMCPDDPVIETNNSWHRPRGRNKGYCKGYRLISKYMSGGVIYVELGEKFSSKYNRIWSQHNQTENDLSGKYLSYFYQFEEKSLTLHPMVNYFISKLRSALLEKINNDFQQTYIHNLIGRLCYHIEVFEKREIWFQVSPTNHRITSSFTNIPKYLRPFVLCSYEQLASIDIVSSQPYILATIMNYEFFTSRNKEFSLYNLYKELYFDITSKMSNIYTSSTYVNTNNELIDDKRSPTSFMWCPFLSCEEHLDIEEYRSAPFDEDFYSHVMVTSQNMEVGNPLTRNDLKKGFMYFLFQHNLNHRRNDINVNAIKIVYPGVDKWIQTIHKTIGSTKFSYLLQRAESFLILKRSGQCFMDTIPTAPLFSIHDSLYTHQQYIPSLTSITKEEYYKSTGIEVGIKSSLEEMNPIPSDQLIAELWKPIEVITSKKRYDAISRKLFPANIERGYSFQNR